MLKRIFCVLAAMLLVCLVLPAFAEETGEETEENLPLASPTDLCLHEHTEAVYYFDSPVYTPVDAWTHRVSGRAMVELVCTDCGTVLSATVEDDAEEIKNHVFRRGQCVLCGLEGEPSPGIQEVVVVLEADEENENQFLGVFTVRELENAGDILVLRAGELEPAVTLQPRKLAEQMQNGDLFSAEMLITGEHAVDVFVHVTPENGEPYAPDGELLSLRFYGERTEDAITVRWTDPEDETNTEEQEAAWVDGGNGGYYMAFPFLGDGTYEY